MPDTREVFQIGEDENDGENARETAGACKGLYEDVLKAVYVYRDGDSSDYGRCDSAQDQLDGNLETRCGCHYSSLPQSI